MKSVIIILMVIVPCCAWSQVHMAFSTGLAGFGMQDMKLHQSELQSQFPVHVKTIESFPAFWSSEFSITSEVSERLRVGGMIGYMSTGGRMHYRDYSGEIECNQVTSAFVMGGQIEVKLNKSSKWPVLFTAKTGAAFGRYALDLSYEITDEHYVEDETFNSINIFIEPGLKLSKSIVGPLSAFGAVGFNLNVYKGKLKWSEDKEAHLLNENGDDVKLNWTGFRSSIGLSVVF